MPFNEEFLQNIFLKQAAERPDDIALVGGKQRLSFSELARHGMRIAERLRTAGVGRDDIVGLFLTPSIELVTATWGTLLAGAAYLPLAPDYPEDRVAYMIDDSRLTMIITVPELRAKLEDLLDRDVEVVTLDEALIEAAGESPIPRLDYSPRASDAAYVIYTSGTTGRPKGVLIEHGAIASQLAWLRDDMGIDSHQTVLLKTPISFDAAQWELLAPAAGSQVVVGDPGLHRDPAGLIDTIVEHDVTVLQCVPTLLQALVDDDLFGRCASLSRVFSGGEALSRRLAARFTEVLPDCELINLYGPTECTINASAHVVTAADLRSDQHTVPIGTPVAGTGFHILDDRQRPVDSGGVGELYIGGVQLARGYLHRDEETAARFVTVPVGEPAEPVRLYRTGDLVGRNDDGAIRFAGRIDNQVKVRGHRIELDEIRVAIENHDWVQKAAVLVNRNDRTGTQQLVAGVELNPREAALMDQGNHGAHHQSKQSRLQVRAQLANPGVVEDSALAGREVIGLPGRTASPAMRRRAFARKTYRFFEGAALTKADLTGLLEWEGPAGAPSAPLETLDIARIAAILRNFGQFHSPDRLLPKYAYASPGALYATQLYVELHGVPGIRPGDYYYHPVRHELVLIHPHSTTVAEPRVVVHLLGKRSAIESVYQNNVIEVLTIEAGHMLGLFDQVLPEYGLAIGAGRLDATAPRRLGASDDHEYLGGYEIVPAARGHAFGPLDTYVQVHPDGVRDLEPGQYRYLKGELEKISDALLLRKHVIAINQEVYQRSAIGISLISRSPDPLIAYVELGRRLQNLQMNPFKIGFMSSGYSSETGNPLPSARRINAILRDAGLPPGPSYFFLGGGVSDEQIADEGMKEDAVHTQGPAEMIKRDIARFLPPHMIPGRLVVMDELPCTVNGKIDVRALEGSLAVSAEPGDRVVIGPRSAAEHQVFSAWSKVMKTTDVSVRDDFFEFGGNSLLAVQLIQKINRAANADLPLQVIFDAPTIEQLASRIEPESDRAMSRLVKLQPKGTRRPIVCWPGLGGYPMNLKPLAMAMGEERPFYGVQAAGINSGETPYSTVAEMAERDLRLIRQLQPGGPYTLWGYSFGARVAFEAAHQLEAQGESVDQLLLIAPGSPVLRADPAGSRSSGALYDDPAFITLVYSVFAGRISGPELDECLRRTRDESSFVDFVSELDPELDIATARRIIAVVRESYSFRYTFQEMLEKQVKAPISLIKVKGDDYSFVEHAMDSLTRRPDVIELDFDHYGVLRPPSVHELASVIRERVMPTPHHGSSRIDRKTRSTQMPHVNIKHFPVQISQEKQGELVDAITAALESALGCTKDAVSVALEPISPAQWQTAVYEPEIERRSHLLCKTPKY